MIYSVDQYGDQLVIRDRGSVQIGSISLSGGEYIGHSSKFVLVRYGDMIVSMDENQRNLGSTVLPSNYRITNINENGFTAKTGNILEKYDPYCNYLGSF